MRVWRSAVVGLFVLSACAGGSNGTVATTTAETIPTTVASTTTLPLVAGCPGDGDFAEGGAIETIEQGGSDSDTVGSIGWEATESCETFTIEFETSEGAPPTTPPDVVAEYLESVPVIRVHVDVDSTAITDQLVETAMVERVFVVRDLEGGMIVDFHLAAPAQARITTQNSPARLTLELQPGIVDHPDRAAVADQVVLLNPVDGITVGGPIAFFGYSRTFESNVLIIATSEGEVVFEDFTTAADSQETWGEFELEATLPQGDLSVFVGDESAEDGSLDGVTVSLTVE